MDLLRATVLPPEKPPRARHEYFTLLRRQYEALDHLVVETGLPAGAIVRRAIDEAAQRRGLDGDEPVILEVPS